MGKKKLSVPKHEFCFIVFVDPAYSSGWTSRGDEPDAREIVHVGSGVIVRETKKTITIALMVGLFDKDKTEDVLNPFMLHKDKGILWLHRFTWEDYNGIKKSKRIRKEIDGCIATFLNDCAGTEDNKEGGGVSKASKPLHKSS